MPVHPLPETLRSAPFTTAAALSAGLRPGVLTGPAVERLFLGAYRPARTELTLDVLVAAALLVAPADPVVTGVTALRLRGAAVGPLRPLHLVTTHRHPVRRPGLRVTRSQVLPACSDRVADPAPAFVAAASHLDLVELVTAGDHLVRRGLTTVNALAAGAADFHGRGAVLARRAAALVRERVDSPPETELRLCLVLAGLPEPVCNVLIGGPDAAVGRGDLVYRAYKLVLEYEGDQHRTDVRQWNRDIERQEQLTADAWTVVRITAARMRRPRSVVARALQALRDAGYAGPDPVFTAEWCALFDSSVRSQRQARSWEPL